MFYTDLTGVYVLLEAIHNLKACLTGGNVF